MSPDLGLQFFVNKYGQDVTVVELGDANDLFDVEWVKNGRVVRYRMEVPRHTVEEMKRYERWADK